MPVGLQVPEETDGVCDRRAGGCRRPLEIALNVITDGFESGLQALRLFGRREVGAQSSFGSLRSKYSSIEKALMNSSKSA